MNAPSLVTVLVASGLLLARTEAAQQPESAGLAAFDQVRAVLMSPRCVNCHIEGESPLQGDDSHPHAMRVKRGVDGRGTPALRCRACHQATNLATMHAPPGAEDWRLPPPNARMAWRDLSASALCRNLKTPAMTGGKSLTELIRHVREDHLVHWGWDPGPGRTRPPISHEAFVAAFTTWAQSGAPCPVDGGAR